MSQNDRAYHLELFRQATSPPGWPGLLSRMSGRPATNRELRAALRIALGGRGGRRGRSLDGRHSIATTGTGLRIWVMAADAGSADRSMDERPLWSDIRTMELAREVYDIPLHMRGKVVDVPGTSIARPADTTPSAFASARTALAEARTTVEAKDVHDKAEGLRAYARLAGDRSLEIEAAEIRIRAARRLGEMLVGTVRSTGRPKNGSSEEPFSKSLIELGVSKKLSTYAQQLAALSEADFDNVMTSWRTRVDGASERVTTTIVRELERRRRNQDLGGPPPVPEGTYRVIYADPPWRFVGGQGRGAANHYPTMADHEIKDLSIAELADPQGAALFMWTPCSFVDTACDVMLAWGFRPITVPFVWMKTRSSDERDRLGMGFWTRIQTELVLLGVRGRIARLEGATRVEQIIRAPVGAHSAKPAEVYERIERLLNGPYIELFARGDARPGWDTWGLEAKHSACPCCGYQGPADGRACRVRGINPEMCRRCPAGQCPKNCAGRPEGPA